ncbi:hypothetical protein EXT70_24810, partial [Dickeya dadantii]|nr:hypothetical protein [Dickeya dadantii]
EKLFWIERKVGKPVIDAAIVGPKVDVNQIGDRLVVQQALAAEDEPHHHDRQLLRQAIDRALQLLGS